jgi:AGCS family alanine or glycine:cation symporter
MELISEINKAVSSVVWGTPMIILIVCTGLLLTVRCHFIQFRKFGCAMRHTLFKLFSRQRSGKGSVTPFQAVATSLAATIGTGNIVGISAAISLGGAGAVFWMWVSAFIGMCTKYVEIVLSVFYRRRNTAGDLVGGPMYYITRGLGPGYRWLAVIFSFLGAICALFSGNAVQAANITDAVTTAVDAISPNHSAYIPIICATVLVISLALVLFGGMKRVGSVSEKLVPFMGGVYILCALAVITVNVENIVPVFRDIIQGAFNPSAVYGGAAGITLKSTVSWGFRRGIFSNEAGLGSAPIAHAAAETEHPVRQGFYGIFEVFMSTIVICTFTALPILICGTDIAYGTVSTSLITTAFSTVFGTKLAGIIISVVITLFAFSTLIGWSLYGVRCAEFLFGCRIIPFYRVLFVAVTALGALMDLGLAWDLADTFNGLMSVPNLIALICLSGTAARLTKAHFTVHKSG